MQQQRAPRRIRGKAALTASPKVLDSTRERILRSAGQLLAEQGFDNVSIRMIAKASHITPGAVYKHFSSKSDLLFEAVERLVQSTPLMARGAKDGDDGTLLPLVAAAYTEPDLKLLRQLSIEIHYASTRDKKVNRVLNRSDELAIRRARDSIAAAQRRGKLDRTLGPDFAARALIVFVMGLTHMDTLLPDLVGDRSWREFVRDRVAKLIGMS